MKCNKFLKAGLLYFYGELKGSGKDKFEKHLRECEICHSQLEELKEITESYRDLPLQEPSLAVVEKILAKSRICGDEGLERSSSPLYVFINFWQALKNFRINWSVPRLATATAGVAIVLITIGYFLLQFVGTRFIVSKLEWSNGLDAKVETVSEQIQDLFYAYAYEEEFLTTIDTKIEELGEEISNIKNQTDLEIRHF